MNTGAHVICDLIACNYAVYLLTLVTNVSRTMYPKLANIQNSAAVQWLEICLSLKGAVTGSMAIWVVVAALRLLLWPKLLQNVTSSQSHCCLSAALSEAHWIVSS